MNSNKTKLTDCPVGLFMYEGYLALKTEYALGNNDKGYAPMCYIVESGEVFWGGANNYKELCELEVEPVNISPIVFQQPTLKIGDTKEKISAMTPDEVAFFLRHELNLDTRWLDKGDVDRQIAILEKAANALENMGLRSVRDMLPKEGKDVIFYTPGNEAFYIGKYHHTGERGCVYFSSRSGRYSNLYPASHWCSLPESPRYNKEDILTGGSDDDS